MDLEKVFGGSPLGVLLRLVIISLIVGVVLAAFDLQPAELVRIIKDLVVRIYELGFDAIGWIFDYFLLGAVIVFPIWIIVRLIKSIGRKDTSA